VLVRRLAGELRRGVVQLVDMALQAVVRLRGAFELKVLVSMMSAPAARYLE